MIVDFLYNNPTWLMGLIVTGGIASLSAVGCYAAHHFLPRELRKKHNEFIGFTGATVSVFYAILLAFIAIAAWESYGKAGAVASREASLVGDIYRDAAFMPDSLRRGITPELDDYIEVVLHEEWPAMAAGRKFGANGWTLLQRAHTHLAQFHPANVTEDAMFREMLQRMNTLYDARRERILASEDRLEPAIWGVVICGMTLTIAFTFLFGMDSFKMHLTMVTMVAASIGLVVVLIIAFDYPFRGEVQIKADAIEQVKQNLEVVRADDRPPRAAPAPVLKMAAPSP